MRYTHRHKGIVKYRTSLNNIRFRKKPIHKHIVLTFSDGKKRKVPFVEPMRPKETGEIPKGNIILEEKMDGSLTMQYSYPNALAYTNRRGVDKTNIYPELSDTEKMNVKDLTITQGETYALKGKKDNFDAFLKRDLLQDPVEAKRRMKKYPLKYEAFDILMKDGKWVTDKPLKERKELLDIVIPAKLKDIKEARVYKDINKARVMLKKDKTVEGVVYKDLDSEYKSGKNRDWVKEKFRKTADVLITDYEKGEGKRKNIGALNAAVLDHGKLRQVARIGTGFTDKELSDIKKKLDAGNKVFGSVDYLNLTGHKNLRAPSWKGERTDLHSVKETHV